MKVTPTFMSSTCISSTIKTLCFSNIQIQSDIFIRGLANLINLRELRLNSVKCSDKSFLQVNEQLNTPQLDHLYIYECPNGKLISALSKIETQSKQIEFSFDHDLSSELVSLLNSQKCLESLVIFRTKEENMEERDDIEFFFDWSLVHHVVKHENLKKIVMYEDEDIESLYPLNTGFSNFLIESACNLRELHLTTISRITVETIAKFMKIEKLCYTFMEDDFFDYSWKGLPELVLVQNNFLKKLGNYSESEYGMAELLSIFPAVETLVSMYDSSMNDALQNLNSLKHWSLQCGNDFDVNIIPALPLPTIKTVHFYLNDFRNMEQFLETNCRTIETLIVKRFIDRSEDPAKPLSNAIMKFFLKFKKVDLLNIKVNGLEIFNHDTSKCQNKVLKWKQKLSGKPQGRLEKLQMLFDC